MSRINSLTEALFFTEMDGQSHEQGSGYSQAFGKTLQQQGIPFEDGNWWFAAKFRRRQQQSGVPLLDRIGYNTEKKYHILLPD